MRINLGRVRLVNLAACAGFGFWFALPLLTFVVLILATDFFFYAIIKIKSLQQENAELYHRIAELHQQLAQEYAKLGEIDLSDIAAPPTEPSHQKVTLEYAVVGEAIGYFNNQPIYEKIIDVSTDEEYQYVGTAVGENLDQFIERMMLNNKLKKVVRLESGIVYAQHIE